MSDRPHVFFIDNFDSFTFNLVDELRKLGAEVDVWRNDIDAERAIELALAMPKPRLIVLSPGPGRPEEAGCCEQLVQHASGEVPVFGVCLGLQAIVQSCGGTVGAAGTVVHGKSDWVEHQGQDFLEGLPSPLQVGRYHSLVATSLPEALIETARSGPLTMAVAHRAVALAGVQFHPESILTPHGAQLLRNVLAWAGDKS